MVVEPESPLEDTAVQSVLMLKMIVKTNRSTRAATSNEAPVLGRIIALI